MAGRQIALVDFDAVVRESASRRPFLRARVADRNADAIVNAVHSDAVEQFVCRRIAEWVFMLKGNQLLRRHLPARGGSVRVVPVA